MELHHTSPADLARQFSKRDLNIVVIIICSNINSSSIVIVITIVIFIATIIVMNSNQSVSRYEDEPLFL